MYWSDKIFTIILIDSNAYERLNYQNVISLFFMFSGRKEMCQYYEVDMSLDGTFMTMICKGPDVPYACIHPHTPSDPKSQNIKTFETNPRIERLLETLDMPTLQFLEVPVSGTNQKAQVKLMFPPNFDPGSGKKYPLVVYAYGGPGYQSVNAKFDFSEIGTYLAGSQDVIYATVDPRGSGYQGEDWRFAVYKKFGTAEVQSLTEVTKHLQVRTRLLLVLCFISEFLFFFQIVL